MKAYACVFLLPLLAACTQKPVLPLPAPTTMSMLTRLEYPKTATTVKQAADYVLRPTGYHIVETCPNCPLEAKQIAEKPPSPLSLEPELTSVQRALILIGGSRTAILVDPDHKAIAYTWRGVAP